MPGSPFRPTITDPGNVRLVGGWNQFLDNSGRIKLPAKLAFDIGTAGPGNLECKLAGRKMNGQKNGNRVRFELSAEGLNSGEHDFDIRFANISLPEAPTIVVAFGDQVVLTGKGLAHAMCGEPAVFNIDGSKAGPGNVSLILI